MSNFLQDNKYKATEKLRLENLYLTGEINQLAKTIDYYDVLSDQLDVYLDDSFNFEKIFLDQYGRYIDYNKLLDIHSVRLENKNLIIDMQNTIKDIATCKKSIDRENFKNIISHFKLSAEEEEGAAAGDGDKQQQYLIDANTIMDLLSIIKNDDLDKMSADDCRMYLQKIANLSFLNQQQQQLLDQQRKLRSQFNLHEIEYLLKTLKTLLSMNEEIQPNCSIFFNRKHVDAHIRKFFDQHLKQYLGNNL